MKVPAACSALLLAATALLSQNYDLLNRPWPAKWIDVPGVSLQDYGVYHFRRSFDLPSKPEHFTIHISGDNRYELYVNGERISWGPARGDLTHWRYETVDIAPQLRSGKNALAAVVWNDGVYKAVAQVTNQTGFVLQADLPQDAVVNTNGSWKCIQDQAYSPQPLPPEQNTGYYALAANEKFNANLYPWGWQLTDYNDSSWVSAHEISPAAPRDARDAGNRWMLIPRPIPLEEQTPQRIPRIRKAAGVAVPEGFPGQPSPLTVPAHTTASLLLDQTYLTTAYPVMTVSGGKGATINLRYAESLYVQKLSAKHLADKGNRNDVDGKTFLGSSDAYVADGGSHRIYRPLFWRTYRYVKLELQTSDEPLIIEDLEGIFTAYPFQRKSTFQIAEPTANKDIQQILSTGWHTARLCAHETYMDCPYYEQLQYAGDARIQMMVSLYMTGDSRLMKNGIGLLNSSRTAEGATYSRAPSFLQQYIPPFSLWWVGMIHDYWMYVDDIDFVKDMLPGVRSVLAFYVGYQKANGSLRRMPWWNFVDWVKQWPEGEAPGDVDGSSAAALDLQLLLAYQWAGDLETAVGSRALAGEYKTSAEKLKAAILATDWDPARELFADQPSHRSYSQQVNTLAVLAGIVPPQQARSVVEKIISDTSLAQSSIYFRAYTNATLRKVGLGERYIDMLGAWREMLNQGLTTWAEWSGPDARSDCHAWGSSPNYELLRTVAGIESVAPGFRRVRIAPNLGKLQHVTATMPHPNGEIRVDLQQRGGKPVANVELPSGVSGEFDWAERRVSLKSGQNHLEL